MVCIRRGVAAAATALALALCPWLWAAGSAQDKNTVWTKVSAQGTTVVLGWHKDHPWDAELRTGGVQLVARYRSGARDDAQIIARSAASGRNERALQFALPATLATPGSGSTLCLYFQMPNRRALPIRRSNEQNSDTAGFRYEQWEAQLRQQNALREITGRVSAAERALATSLQNLSSQQTIVTQRGWRDPASCNSVSVANTDVRAKPYNVVSPDLQDEVARRVCVYRVWRSRQINDSYIREGLRKDLAEASDPREGAGAIRGVFTEAFQLPELARFVVSATGADVTQRRAQAAEFLRDWERFSSSSSGYQPHVRGAQDILKWTPSAVEVAYRVFGPGLARELNFPAIAAAIPPAGPADRAGVEGAALDAYSGCLEDARAQLAIQYENWEGLKSSAPQRAAASAAFFARECRQDLDLLDRLKLTESEMRAQLTREQQNLERTSTSTRPLPTSPQDLNAAVCK